MSTNYTPTNKVTRNAGLIFNVNSIKKNIKEYFKNMGDTSLKFGGGHISITAAIEGMYKLILTESLLYADIDTSNLKVITRKNIWAAITSNLDLNKYYNWHMKIFDENMMYNNQMPVATTEIRHLLDKINTTSNLTEKAFNLLNYMLVVFYTNILATSRVLLQYSGKKMLNNATIFTAISIELSGNVRDGINRSINSALSLTDKNAKEHEELSGDDIINNENIDVNDDVDELSDNAENANDEIPEDDEDEYEYDDENEDETINEGEIVDGIENESDDDELLSE